MPFIIEDGTLKKYIEEEGVTEVIIPDTVREIGKKAFNRCYNITSVKIPNTVTNMGHGTFRLCTSLTTITIPDSIKEIYAYIFNGCDNLIITYKGRQFKANSESFYKYFAKVNNIKESAKSLSRRSGLNSKW